QQLPATQRAALVLRDVLGFSAHEAADTLNTTVASVNEALRRARQTMRDRLPERSQHTTLRALGDRGMSSLVDSYVDASERADLVAILSMLAEDATFSMPALPTWYRGRDEITILLTRFALLGRWRLVPVRANGQLAFANYAWEVEQQMYEAQTLDV